MEERFRDWSLRFSWRDEPQSAFHGFTIEEDEKTMARAMRLLLNCQAPPEIHQEIKDAQHSRELMEFGHRLSRRRTWRILLEVYTQALMFAPPNSSLLAENYFYCALQLYKGRLYRASLLHCDRSLENDPPDNLKAKIYIYRARNIYEMNGRKVCSVVDEAINNTRFWLRAMNQLDPAYSAIAYMIDLLNMSPILAEPLEIYHDQNVHNDQELTFPDDNDKIEQASSAIEIKYNEENGRYIAASRNINAGEVLFAHKSYSSIIYPKLQNEYCWYCSKIVLAVVPCKQCSMIIYCNENCRDKAWQEYHDLECLALPAMMEVEMKAEEITTLRLLIKAYKEANCSIDELRAKVIALENIEDPIEKLCTNGKFDNTKYASIFSLTRRFPVISTHASRSAIILLFLGATTDIFSQRITDYAGLEQTEGTKFMGSLIMRHLGICYNNAIGELQRSELEPIRLQINPLLSLFNHSCDPSVLVHTYGDMKYCIAIKDIARGEQIYRCYLRDDWEMSVANRNDFLQKSFNFDCACNACRNNWQRYIRRKPPSLELENYPAAVIHQWNLITRQFPLEKDICTTNVSFYSEFFY
ncbi:hypothetical protein PV327_001192 [Microctonus hyperodae]|uniref:SET and MYND domain-containing protein 4 n=1 Tax=Microctonus hyperodae TaxID=165561 RepID=A0AA39G7P6_MICHY|nr:hypothetical protein PV327_001192 [Microctonus hyperodae]